MLAGLARLGPPADHELLLLEELQLAPRRRSAPAVVRRVAVFDDQAFPALALRPRAAAPGHRRATRSLSRTVAGRPASAAARPAGAAAAPEGPAAQVRLAVPQQIEHDDRGGLLLRPARSMSAVPVRWMRPWMCWNPSGRPRRHRWRRFRRRAGADARAPTRQGVPSAAPISGKLRRASRGRSASRAATVGGRPRRGGGRRSISARTPSYFGSVHETRLHDRRDVKRGQHGADAGRVVAPEGHGADSDRRAAPRASGVQIRAAARRIAGAAGRRR